MKTENYGQLQEWPSRTVAHGSFPPYKYSLDPDYTRFLWVLAATLARTPPRLRLEAPGNKH